MNKKKTSNVGIVKYALFVPFFAALLFVSNLQAQDDVAKEIKNLDETVVIDATNNTIQVQESQSEEGVKPGTPAKSDNVIVKKIIVRGIEIPQGVVVMLNGKIVPREELNNIPANKFESVSVMNDHYNKEFGGKSIYVIQTRP